MVDLKSNGMMEPFDDEEKKMGWAFQEILPHNDRTADIIKKRDERQQQIQKEQQEHQKRLAQEEKKKKQKQASE